MITSIAALALSTAYATTPADKYGECGDYQKQTQSYDMQDYNGHRTIWAPGLFCKRKTALLSMQSGVLTLNPDGSGSFEGKAKVVSGGCGTFDGTVWDVSYDVNGTDPKYSKGPSAPAGYPWQLGLVENGEMSYGNWTMYFDNYPNNNDYGHQAGVRANVKDNDLGGAFWFDYWLKKNGYLIRDGKGDFNFDLECRPPENNDCPTDGGLGDADGYNVFTCGDFTGHNSDIQGKAAIGGNMDVSGYGVGSGLGAGSGTVLSVAHDLDFHNGQVYGGDAEVGGYCNTSSLGTPHGSLTCGSSGVFDAGDSCDDLCDVSGYIGAKDNTNCSITVHAWGQVDINATGDAVCNLDLDKVAADFADYVWNGWINGITVNAGYGDTVLINVTSDNGNDIWGKNGSFNLSGGVKANSVVWNFPCGGFCPSDAYSPLSGVQIKGSILAPSCHTHFNNGAIDGQYIVKSHNGNGQFHSYDFDGDICIDDGKGGKGRGEY